MIKYIIQLKVDYFQEKYPGFLTLKRAKQESVIEKEYKKMVNACNKENAKVIISNEGVCNVYKVEENDTFEIKKPEGF